MTKHRPQSKTSSLYHLSMNFPTLFQTKPNYLKTNVWKRGSNQFIQQTKQTKQTKNQNETKKKTLQEQHNCAWNNKNEAFGRNLGFLLMKKGMPWASPRFDACTCWIFLGVTRVASPILSFSPFFISLLIPSIHLKFFLHTKLHTIFISNISALKINKS